MSHLDVIRAWKDEDYRLSLSDAQRAQLPESPVGLIELTDLDMGMLAGGGNSNSDNSMKKNYNGSKGHGKGCYSKSRCAPHSYRCNSNH